MQNLILKSADSYVDIVVIKPEDYQPSDFSDSDQAWLLQHEFTAKAGQFCCLPAANGQIAKVVVGYDQVWELGAFANKLPAGTYKFVADLPDMQLLALSWALSQYQYLRYLKTQPRSARFLIVEGLSSEVYSMLAASKLVRDLINTPAADMGPVELAEQAINLAQSFSAEVAVTTGDLLLEKGFPAIHAVGRAAPQAPRLIDIEWQMSAKQLPLIVLVGKGVCFDTGGLDLKNAAGMLGMKKDMGGAANVLGLAHCIMAESLPVRLKVLIPAVENSIDSNAYRPSDIITMRDGSSVEVTNTDAEGRLVLADALTYASEYEPDLIIDMATLTGAARVAVGTEVSAAFTDDESVLAKISAGAKVWQDPVCFLPLYRPYKSLLKSNIADISNTGKTGYAGAITAALFLQKFVKQDIPWVHFDIMAANLRTSAGRIEGGEAMGIRALYYMIKELYCG